MRQPGAHLTDRAPRRHMPYRQQAIAGETNGFSKKIGEEDLKLACKPGSVEDSHSSRRRTAVALKQPTRKRREQRRCFPIWSCSRWGLPCHSRYRECGELLPRRFALACAHVGHRRCVFCCVEKAAPGAVAGALTCDTAIQPRLRGTFHSLTASGR